MSIESLTLTQPASAKNYTENNSPKNFEFVRNFDFVRNNSIEITSNTTPTLFSINGNEEQAICFRFDENNTVQIRNGAIYNATIDSDIIEKHSKDLIPAGEASIKDGALSFGLNRFRVPSAGNTETQKILTKLKETQDPGERKTELTKLVKSENSKSLDRAMRLTMVNDPVRRAFESYYAKHALQDYFSTPKKYAKLVEISNNKVNYIKDHFASPDLFKKFEAAWKNENFDTTICGLDQLQGFYERAELTLETLNIPQRAREALFDIYKGRYLSYTLKNDPDVNSKLPKGHWDGIFDPIKAPGKGRIELNVKKGSLFRQAESHNIGIMRNIDPTPMDLRLNEPYHIKYASDYENSLLAGASTRCPDRLEMQDPSHPDAFKPGSYLKDLFKNGTGTYVNGPSGSILIEHGALRACKNAHTHMSPPDLETYLEVQALLFIYIDGGHSMHEISYALTCGNAQEKFHEAFGRKEGFERIGENMFMNYEALDKAAKDAATFNDALKTKDSVHHEITHTNPAGPHTPSETNDLAMKQSVDGRNVLYRPGDALLKELGTAASVLHNVISNLSPDSQKMIGAHLLAEGRLLDGKTTADLLAALERVSTNNKVSSAGAASATDRAVVIALMGDIGGFYTTPANANVQLMTELNSQLTTAGLHVPEGSEIQNMRNRGGSGAVGPDKRAERRVTAFASRADIPFRAGVHNMGKEADKLLSIATQDRIPENRWAVFDISTPRIKETTEPFVGHMSASPAEILQAWDMLCGVAGEEQYVGALTRNSARQEGDKFRHPLSDLTSAEQAQRYARAAGASAFLVGLGYHTAVEVLEGTLVYTGQSIRTEGTLSQSQRDSAHVFGHGAATDLMTELFRANTAI